MIIGSTLNLCLLWALLSDRQLRCDPRNSFILALSFSDFLLCNFTCPVTFWSMVAGKWPFGKDTEILCKFFKAAQDFPIVMSSFCIGAIACDRHRVIIQTSSTQMNAIQVNWKFFIKVTIVNTKEISFTHCLKITQNFAFEFLNFGIFHQFCPTIW